MTKEEYLAELEKRLAGLAAEERAELMADFAAHFDHGRAAGKSEEDIARKLGTPQLVAREILYQLKVDEARANPSVRRIARAVTAGAGLGLMNVAALLIPFAAGWIILAALFAVSLYLVSSPVLMLIQDGWTPTYWLELPLAAGLVGIGLILWAAAARLASWFTRFMLSRLQRNVNTMKGKWA